MAAERNKIVNFCDELLRVHEFEDGCHNGLQIEGVEIIENIIVGVSLSKQLIDLAIKNSAQMIIVHHGISTRSLGTPPAIKGMLKERIKLLLENNINLCGYHLPLDAHEEIGNNIALCEIFDLKKVERFNVGFYGQTSKKRDFMDFVELVSKKLDTECYYIPAGPKTVNIVGIISGDASSYYEEAKSLGIDTFVTGGIKENNVREIEETKINFINAGHYNTEKLGVQNLGVEIAKKFKVKVEYVDVPCDI